MTTSQLDWNRPLCDAAAGESLNALYHEHHSQLQGWLRRRLGCQHSAADLAHDTFLRLLARPRAVDGQCNPAMYLRTIARGLMIDHWRRKEIERAWAETIASLPISMQPSLEHQAVVLETLRQIDAMLDRMPSKPREAFLMAQLHGAGHAQIAQQLRVSERMVRKYLSQAMMHCLTLAEDDGR